MNGRTTDGKIRVLCDMCKSKGEVPDTSGRFVYMKCPQCGGKGWTETVEGAQ